MADALECPVCLTLPDGQVHQCLNGHCYCVECWNTLEPRRCPECREPLPQMNRNRDREGRIADLHAQCDHCGEATTRGTKQLHMHACSQRPMNCMGAAAGCSWAGVAAEQHAHEAACPLAGCQRLMAPLQARCDGLLAQNQQLQVRCDGLQVRCDGIQAALEPVQAWILTAQNQQLIAQNEQRQSWQAASLQRQVAALEPLVGRVRALEGEEEAGGWRQRQRTGPAPYDTPPYNVLPHDAAVSAMGPVELVAVLRAHKAVARVVVTACNRLAALCLEEVNQPLAAEAGALEAVVEAMRAHPQAAGVQHEGCAALVLVCLGMDGAGLARKHSAVEAGALEAVVGAMWAHPQAEGVQQEGCAALLSLCCGRVDAVDLAHKQRAAEAGALEAVVAAMWAHLQAASVQWQGCAVLTILCIGPGGAAAARRQLATQVGACAAATAARLAHPDDTRVHDTGRELQRSLGLFD